MMKQVEPMAAEMRLQKFLSQAGVCSRRAGEAHILRGDVRVNGLLVRALGTKVDPEKDKVTFQGQMVEPSTERIYLILNKPPGYVTSCKQPHEKVVLDLINLPQRLIPVGRLDKDSEGLLLLTNDGALHHRLLHPSFDHEKEYLVTVANPIAPHTLRRLAGGIELDGRRTRPAVVRAITRRKFRIILKEGRNRQIRRMVGHVGHRVVRLKRIRFGYLRLGELAPGVWRHLTPPERERLLLLVRGEGGLEKKGPIRKVPPKV
jgi:23S rRNA pseudouridine2605 synthase/23S rRNA pseudouridine2604 synthase